MRIRNVKPQIVTNEDLADLPREVRLCFIYLWMACDKEGRVEDRPRRLRADLFPLDEDVTSDTLSGWLDQLAAKGFILRYESQGVAAIQVLKFTKHQALSTWERTKTKSEIPPPPVALRADHGSPTVELQKGSRSTSEVAQPPANTRLHEDYSSPTLALPPEVETYDVGRMTSEVETKEREAEKPPAAGAAPLELATPEPKPKPKRKPRVLSPEVEQIRERIAETTGAAPHPPSAFDKLARALETGDLDPHDAEAMVEYLASSAADGYWLKRGIPPAYVFAPRHVSEILPLAKGWKAGTLRTQKKQSSAPNPYRVVTD